MKNLYKYTNLNINILQVSRFFLGSLPKEPLAKIVDEPTEGRRDEK
jgi:hypothetical protein